VPEKLDQLFLELVHIQHSTNAMILFYLHSLATETYIRISAQC